MPGSLILKSLHALLLLAVVFTGASFAIQHKEAELGKPNETSSRYVFLSPSKSKNTVVVFIHGIFGDALKTWYNQSTSRHFFDLMKDDRVFADADFYVYGFPSDFLGHNAFSIEEAADGLDQALNHNDIFSYKSIVLVAHSMGGLVAEKYILKYRKTAAQIPLLFMFSTPQEGAEITHIAKYITRNPAIEQMIPGDKNKYLDDLDSSWKAGQADGTIPTQVRCAHELLPTIAGSTEVIVGKFSATRLCLGVSSSINADHINIVKPDSSSAPAYVALSNAYRSVVPGFLQANMSAELGMTPLNSPDRVRPLDGFRGMAHAENGAPVYAGGAHISFTLSHNQTSPHSILIRELRLNVHTYRPGRDERYAYKIHGDEIHGAGTVIPYEFRVQVDGNRVSPAKWNLPKGKVAVAKSANFFDYDGAQYITLSRPDDIAEVKVTITGAAEGFYEVSFTFKYSVNRKDKVLTSERLFIYVNEPRS